MNRFVLAPATLLVLFLSWATSAAERPNVLLILVDDLKPALGCYGDTTAKTPNIDTLAARGMRFDRAYCNQAVCAPSRFTLMLGSHSTSTGLYGLGSQLREIVPDAVTLPQHFARYGGYRTESLGKVFHIGHGNLGDPQSFSQPHFTDKVIEYLDPASTDGGKLTREEALFTNQKLGAIRSLPRGAAFESPEANDNAYADGRVAEEAIRRLQAAKVRREKEGTPFFIAAGFVRPHLPFCVPKKYWDLYDPALLPMPQFEQLPASAPRVAGKRGGEIAAYKPVPERGEMSESLKRQLIHGYYASASFVDAQIGKLLAEFDRLGLADNTIVVLWGDHGFHLGDLGIWTKHTNYEQANRIPIFIVAPGVTKPKSSTKQLTESVDLFPTLAELAGLPAPSGPQPVDGLSLVPVLKNPAARVRDHAYHAYPKQKLGRAIRTERYRLVEWQAFGGSTDIAEYELYDYETDPLETKNLAAKSPQVVADLKQILARHLPPVDRRQLNRQVEQVAANQPGAPNDAGPAVKAEPNPPQIKGRAFTITAAVEHEKPNGVIVAHGGLRFGYALYFTDGRPAFAFRNEGKLIELIAEKPVGGKLTVVAALNAETMSIAVDGQIVASRKSPGLPADQPAIGMYVGRDFRDPIGSYKVPNAFNGKILSQQVSVVIPKVTMRTKWGQEVTAENAWQEYPRPALKREGWTNLNGYWDYAITAEATNEAPKKWDGKILVPFAVEAPLSGVERRLRPDDALWYRRTVAVDKKGGRRYRLNFEAVDYACTLSVNGREFGSHVGGNLPFSFDITAALKDGENTLTLRVTDATDSPGSYQLHGKQRLNPRGIWYTPVSGIWQTVWLEEVPETHIAALKITPQINGTVAIQIESSGNDRSRQAKVTASLDGKTVATATGPPGNIQLSIPQPKLWNPTSPTLYDLRIELGDDVVESYVGVREVGKRRDAAGHWRFTLNGRDIFHWGTLDQGWWPDGLLTPPSDEAMRSGIEYLKAAGFNTIRKHIKVEPRRYYYHCDRLGMLLWQDQVSAMADNPEWTRLKPNPETRDWPPAAHRQFMDELKGMIDSLYSHPSIVVWVPFNERWGQHQTKEVGRWTADYDKTRPVNIASGGNFFPAGDVVDHHQYPHPAFPFDLGGRGAI